MDKQSSHQASGPAHEDARVSGPPGGLTVDPALFQSPLTKASTILRNLLVKPTAEAIAGAASAVADAARTVAQAPTVPSDPSLAPSPQAPSPRSASPRATAADSGGRRSTRPLKTDELRLGLREHEDAGGAEGGTGRSPVARASLPDEVWFVEQGNASPERMELLRRALRRGFDNLTGGERTTLYRVLTEERTYRQVYLEFLEQRLRSEARPRPDQAELKAIRARMQQHLAVQAQLFQHLKTLTGRVGATGGTGFLGKPKGKPDRP